MLVTATAEHDGLRLDLFLTGAAPKLSRTRIQTLIRAGHVSGESGTIVDPKYRVKPGETFVVQIPAVAPSELTAESIPLTVVFEDDALIVVDKPAGLTVHPGAGQAQGTLVNALLAHCGQSLSGIGGVARPGIVHRLDKDTSGLLVVAKTDEAHHALASQFADHGRTGGLERGYLALVWGAPHRSHGTVDAPVGRHPSSRTKMAVLPRGKGREAVTHWRVLATYGDKTNPIASLLECRLETGRTHQVRVHLAHIGHPLIGDPLYAQGFKSKVLKLPTKAQAVLAKLPRQALHATLLAFEHPTRRTLLKFNSHLPPDLDEIIQVLKEL